MVKRKTVVDILPFTTFVKKSWEKTDKKGDHAEFEKSCELKWQEMTEKQKEEFKKVDENTEPIPKKAKKAVKKEKDPNKPKRPRTSYLFFCDAFRDVVKTGNPKLSMTDVTKELSVRWNALSPAEKQKYIDLAVEEKKKILGNNKSNAQ